MRLIYVQSKPYRTLQDAALAVTRISGEDASIWQIGRALLWKKGFVNGVAVKGVIINDSEAAAVPVSDPDTAPPKQPTRRPPLLRIEKTGGLPPKWM
ncbi:hypothetical protein AGMMS50268_38200 [Spirochaetia bacterium]|nr:hypothetical protein AGMMS50268_38200 [Spirochaetia bacterium]